MSTRFAIALLCSALAACHAGPRRAIPPEAKGAAPVRQPSIRIALGRIPTTSAYRILACSAPSTATCERTLETAIGAEVDFGPGKRAKLTQAIDVKDGAGARVRAFTVDSPLDNVGVFPGGGIAVDRSPKSASLSTDERKAMEARHRRLSPTAVWATGSAIAFESIEANLDGDGAPDRVIVSTLTQSAGKDRSMNTRIVWVSLDGATPEPVEIFAIWTPSLVGTLDFDGDGREEVLTVQAAPTGDAPTIDYAYRLLHYVPGRRLDAAPQRLSEAWQLVAELEDHDHSDE